MSKVVVFGSRDFTDVEFVETCILVADKVFNIHITELISGMCRGVDLIGYEWAERNNIFTHEYPYEREYGKMGGPIRNRKMAKFCDYAIGIWDGKSPGTGNMISYLKEFKKPYIIFYI